ncbi:unnamed protein product [Pleuronectes platessa]|uniref:Secreted protein n=1 Tax=Pleuronectes platessa TaxID=8262 RepID=A0A9N7UCT0_PLEPL|nr:unnamed protein product [Pleuronectes platessa]
MTSLALLSLLRQVECVGLGGVVGPGLSICGGRPPKARHGVNVMFGLVLQQQSVPPAATEHSMMAAHEGRYQASLSEALALRYAGDLSRVHHASHLMSVGSAPALPEIHKG